jgi:hypothetical protein
MGGKVPARTDNAAIAEAQAAALFEELSRVQGDLMSENQKMTREMRDAASRLLDAAAHGNVAELRRLVHDRRIDVNTLDHDRRSACHMAAAMRSLPALEFLIGECAANPNMTDRFSRTPLDEAVAAKHAKAEKYLRKHGAMLSSACSGSSSARSGASTTLSRQSSGGGQKALGNIPTTNSAGSLGHGHASLFRRSWRSGAPGTPPPIPTDALQPQATLFQLPRRDMVTPNHLSLIKTGWLRKLSKGGWTTNWNRRYFALSGSTLFYADNDEKITFAPKVFASMRHLHVLQIDHAGHSFAYPHLFALSDASGEAALYLSASSDSERLDWMRALASARHAPACDMGRLSDLFMLRQRQLDDLSSVCYGSAVSAPSRSAGSRRQGAETGGRELTYSQWAPMLYEGNTLRRQPSAVDYSETPSWLLPFLRCLPVPVQKCLRNI